MTSLGTGVIEMVLDSKWGFDGSSGQFNYKQTFENADADDSSIIITSLVPLHISVKEAPDKIVWHNTKSSSTVGL